LQGKKVDRDIDISGTLFRGDNTSYLLGVSSYFDGFGARRRGRAGCGVCRAECGVVGSRRFKTYYEQLHQYPKFIIQQQPKQVASLCVIL
ncbi:MAG TPA: hypothetical protein VHA13_03110, partial [Gammaproteobacteria bacterium]|nr:hypothetical protein [Gammaproteobacteria bacterium]